MKALNHILSGFVKTIEKLDALARINDTAVGKNTEKIDALKQENLGLVAESQAAKNTSERLVRLLDQEA